MQYTAQSWLGAIATVLLLCSQRCLAFPNEGHPHSKHDSHSTTCEPTATLDVGPVIGTSTTLPSSKAVVNKFLGVQFGKKPKRFSPPQPVGHRSHPVKAQAFTNSCLQQFDSQFGKTYTGGTGYPGESEDCLYLNVYAPAKGAPRKPVMFWLYGGGLKDGTAMQNLYDGSNIAANQDIIVVSPNYRTNVFGFSNSPELKLTSQNVGFLDQRLALDWVQRNIAAFGGDPAKVTIVGESSGASSVDRLVTSPPHPIPFRAAIGESGQASIGVNPVGTSGNVTAWNTLVKALKCESSKSELACVRAADPFVIQGIINSTTYNFLPVTDDVTQLATPINRTLHQSVPIMIGSNGQEGRSLLIQDAATANNLTEFLLSNGVPPEFAAIIEQAYPIQSTGKYDTFYTEAQIYTELALQCPAALVAEESVAAKFPTWRYYFNASFPNTNEHAGLDLIGLDGLELGAYHGSEIALVFGNYPREDTTPEEVALSKTIQTAWAKFIKKPRSTGPGWPSYGLPDGKVNPVGVADLGPQGVTMIPQAQLDARCALYTELYAMLKAPAFR